MKLIKLKASYIIVSDDEIKLEDIAYNITDDRFDMANSSNLLSIQEHWKKVIASTTGFGFPQIDFSELSEGDCKRIGWFNIDILGEDAANEQILRHRVPSHGAKYFYHGFTEGFQKAQKLLSDTAIPNENIWSVKVERQSYESDELISVPNDDIHPVYETKWRPKITNNKIKIIRVI